MRPPRRKYFALWFSFEGLMSAMRLCPVLWIALKKLGEPLIFTRDPLAVWDESVVKLQYAFQSLIDGDFVAFLDLDDLFESLEVLEGKLAELVFNHV
jgi:hypothetical protein